MTDSANQFTTKQITQAAGITTDTLTNWLRRDLIIGHKGMTGGGEHGIRRFFSIHNAMEIAVAKALIDAGLTDLTSAFLAASSFAHAGEGALPKIHPERLPGLPYDRVGTAAETLLAARGSKHKIIFHKIGTDVLPAVYAELGDGFVMIRVDPVFERVMTSLGFDPVAQLNLAYGRQGTRR